MGSYYHVLTAKRQEEGGNRDADAEIAASLIASQTLLDDASTNIGPIPNFNTAQTPPFGRKVHEMTMETKDGGKENIEISYTTLGNLDQINIDKDGDGKVDSKFVRKSGLLGTEIEYYADADGELTARGICDNGPNPLDTTLDKINFEKPDGETIGTVEIKDTFWAHPGLLHVIKDGQQVATGHVDKGQFKEILRIGDGETQLQYRLQV